MSENPKTFSISSKTAAADAAAAAASAAAVLKEIEHVFEFSDASNAQICVIVFWSKPSVFHRKPSRSTNLPVLGSGQSPQPKCSGSDQKQTLNNRR